MATTYDLIGSAVLEATASTITVSSIPDTYDDLVLQWSLNGDDLTTNIRMRLNGDTGTNYEYIHLDFFDTTTTAYVYSGQTSVGIAELSSIDTYRSVGELHINNYASTTQHKTLQGQVFNIRSGRWENQLGVYRWINTAALNEISFFTGDADEYVIGSSLKVYGVKGGTA